MHQEHLGSAFAATDGAGSKTADASYYPYGGARGSSGTLPTEKKFTGQRLDGTGLYYYGARYYDPEIGRFVSPDTIIPALGNPQALNRYTYVYNNPLRYRDYQGRIPVDTIADIAGIGWDIYNLWNEPSWENLGWLGLDVALALVPYVPGTAAFRMAGKGAVHAGSIADEAVPFLDEVVAVGRGADDAVAATENVATAERGFGDLSQADRFGIQNYTTMREMIDGAGLDLQAHHIVEERLAKNLNLRGIDTVAVKPQEHQKFTNRWRDEIAYINSGKDLNTGTATRDDVWAAAQRIYEYYPDILEATRRTLFPD